MTVSMTGFASRKAEALGYSWTWDLRSVNGKGLDLRLRVPDWIDGLELAVRAELARCLSRGNVSVTLKLGRDSAESGAGAFRLNPAALTSALTALAEIENTAINLGVSLRSATTAEVLALRGVTDGNETEQPDIAPLRKAVMADFELLVLDFQAMRAAEGLALHGVVAAQIEKIRSLSAEAVVEAHARRDAQAMALQDAMARILGVAEGLDEARLMQELALIAVKNDVTEELDRLNAHIVAARSLLQETGPVGRKFDFLMQEFMREANTLCSKSQSKTLTRIGLDLKTVIDQMREQVQNVE